MAKKREGVICQGTNVLFAPHGYSRKWLNRGEKVSIFGEDGEYFKIGVNLYVPKFNVIEITQPEATTGIVLEPYEVDGIILAPNVTVGVYGEFEGKYKIRYNRKTLYVSKEYIQLT